MMSVNLSDIAISNIKGADHPCIHGTIIQTGISCKKVPYRSLLNLPWL